MSKKIRFGNDIPRNFQLLRQSSDSSITEYASCFAGHIHVCTAEGVRAVRRDIHEPTAGHHLILCHHMRPLPCPCRSLSKYRLCSPDVDLREGRGH